MMSEHRKQIVAQLKQHAAKQVKDGASHWQKLSDLSDEQIAAVSGQTAGIEGAKARASKYVRNNTELVKKLPTDFKKLADPKYVAEKEKTKAEKAKEAEKPAADANPAKPTAKAAA
jgi:predicted phage tail protein